VAAWRFVDLIFVSLLAALCRTSHKGRLSKTSVALSHRAQVRSAMASYSAAEADGPSTHSV
jgi:hypothetical protein